MAWTIAQSKRYYNLDQWGKDYFSINTAGHITVFPDGNKAGQGIDLAQMVNELIAQGLRLPILIRFADILVHRVAMLNQAFSQAISTHGYQNSYLSIYPIKVNQQYYVAETIYQQENIGLESGSKSELLAVLAVAKDKTVTIVCNGYKDQEYIRLALIAQQLGHTVYIIIEKLSELPMVLAEAGRMQLKPLLGIRVRIAYTAKGKWQTTGGEQSKFGLIASQILQAIDILRQHDRVDCLRLLHCHLGSQISNIRDIQKGLGECSQFFAEIAALGVQLTHIDVGGGLGVDYEGTSSRSECSINYSWQEYANNVVLALKTVCDQYHLPHPVLMTESGRGLTAHHAVLITNIIDVDTSFLPILPVLPVLPVVPDESKLTQAEPAVLVNMRSALTHLTLENAIETYHEMLYWLDEVHHMFHSGAIDLSGRAAAEQLYAQALQQVRVLLLPNIRHHRAIIDTINHKLAEKVFCNLSVFQSLPDAWAIDQIFPIMPLSQLAQQPTRQVVLQDLTCDSDGRINYYIDDHGVEPILTLPSVPDDSDESAAIGQLPPYLGFFMIGAYQEILGDMHNLFGDTDSVHVVYQANAGPDEPAYQLTQQYAGDCAADVLRYVHFSVDDVLTAYEDQLAKADLTASIKQYYLEVLSDGLSGYTYLEQE